jgi:hypothetical protein
VDEEMPSGTARCTTEIFGASGKPSTSEASADGLGAGIHCAAPVTRDEGRPATTSATDVSVGAARRAMGDAIDPAIGCTMDPVMGIEVATMRSAAERRTSEASGRADCVGGASEPMPCSAGEGEGATDRAVSASMAGVGTVDGAERGSLEAMGVAGPDVAAVRATCEVAGSNARPGTSRRARPGGSLASPVSSAPAERPKGEPDRAVGCDTASDEATVPDVDVDVAAGDVADDVGDEVPTAGVTAPPSVDDGATRPLFSSIRRRRFTLSSWRIGRSAPAEPVGRDWPPRTRAAFDSATA